MGVLTKDFSHGEIITEPHYQMWREVRDKFGLHMLNVTIHK